MNKKKILSLLLAFCMLISTISIDAVVSAAEPTNVAANPSGAADGTTISSNYPTGQGMTDLGWGMANMIDGNTGSQGATGMSANYQNTEIYVDLTFQQTYLVSKIRLRSKGQMFPKDFTLNVWTENGWKEVARETDYPAPADLEWVEYEFAAEACRAVRLNVTENGCDAGGTYSLCLREFEVYGVETTEEISKPVALTNVAANPSGAADGTTISSNYTWTYAENHGLGLKNMNDGNVGQWGVTRGNAADQNEVTYIDLIFPKTYLVSQIRLCSVSDGGRFPIDFTLEVWTGSDWKVVADETDYPAPSGTAWAEYSFHSVACRAVRLNVTKKRLDGSDYVVGLAEFEAYGVPSAKIVPVPADPTNVALKKNGTTISSNYEWDKAEEYKLKLENMIDGSPSNWGVTAQSASYQNEEIYIDLTLPQTYLVSKIRLCSVSDGGRFPKDFTLEVWTGSDWEVVAGDTDCSIPTGTTTWKEYSFSATACRAVRLNVTENGSDGNNYCIGLGEFEVYGIPTEEVIAEPPVLYNLAYGMQVTASSVVDWGAPTYGTNLNNLVDNNGGVTNYSSTWGPIDSNYEWVQVTFDAPVRAYYVQFTPWTEGELKSFPKDFKIEVYNGTEWETVIEETNYSKGAYTFEFDKPMECSALRLVATKLGITSSATSYALLIADMKVFGECANVTLQRPDTLGEKINRAEASVVLSKGTNNVALKDHCTNGVVNYTSQLVESQQDEIAIQYLFGRSLYVDSIRFQVHKDDIGKFPSDVDIYAFTGDKWERVLDVTDYTCHDEATEHYFSFEGVYCNSLMIVAKNLYEVNGAYGMRLRNIQVLGAFADDACTLLGDGNGDKKLTEAEDCTAFREYIVNSTESSMKYDINMDATGDVRDLVRMKQYFVSK